MAENERRELNDTRPQVIEHFIGQRAVVERVKVALEAAWNSGSKIPHMLFQGSPGCGKTQLASILAKEMGCDLHEQLAQNLRTPNHLNALLLMPGNREVLLLDEAQELNPSVQVTLYRAMENKQIFLETQKGKTTKPVCIEDFTILAATTDPQCLLQPLRDRFKMVLDFELYSESELATIVANRGKALGWQIEEGVPLEIAKRGKGVPRIAIRLMETSRITSVAEGASFISMKHVERTCRLEGIDTKGLTATEIKYMKILYENEGSVRLNVIASRMSLHIRHVSNIIEQFLLREGLVTKTNSLRVLTQKGLNHLRTEHMGEAI